MEESGRRKAGFCTALDLEDPPIQNEKYPARPVTDMRPAVSDTGHRLTCSARVGATPWPQRPPTAAWLDFTVLLQGL